MNLTLGSPLPAAGSGRADRGRSEPAGGSASNALAFDAAVQDARGAASERDTTTTAPGAGASEEAPSLPGAGGTEANGTPASGTPASGTEEAPADPGAAPAGWALHFPAAAAAAPVPATTTGVPAGATDLADPTAAEAAAGSTALNGTAAAGDAEAPATAVPPTATTTAPTAPFADPAGMTSGVAAQQLAAAAAAVSPGAVAAPPARASATAATAATAASAAASTTAQATNSGQATPAPTAVAPVLPDAVFTVPAASGQAADAAGDWMAAKFSGTVPVSVNLPATGASAAAGTAASAVPALPAAGETAAPAPASAQPLPPVAAPAPLTVTATAAATAAAAPAAPANAGQLLGQVSQPLINLAAAGPGEHVITLKVNPENLGPVTVRAQISSDGVRVEMFAPNDIGREALRVILADLRRDLAGGGSGPAATLTLSNENHPGDGSGRDAAEAGERNGRQRLTAEEPAEPAGAARGTPGTGHRPGSHLTTTALDVMA